MAETFLIEYEINANKSVAVGQGPLQIQDPESLAAGLSGSLKICQLAGDYKF
jgi:hypothetical protein